MIISCPSCKTDYSVSDDILSDIEDPRFHCAICDHYFELSAEILNSKLTGRKEQSAPVSIGTTPQNRKSDTVSDRGQRQERIINSEFAETLQNDKPSRKSSKPSLRSRLFKHGNLFHRSPKGTEVTHTNTNPSFQGTETAAASGAWKLSDSYGTSTRVPDQQAVVSGLGNSTPSQTAVKASLSQDTSSAKRQPNQSNWRNVVSSPQVNTVAKIADWPTPPPPPEGMVSKQRPETSSSASGEWTLTGTAGTSRKTPGIKDTISAKISSIVEFPKHLIQKSNRDRSWGARIKSNSQILNTSSKSQSPFRIRFNIHALLFLSIPALILASILYWNSQIQSEETPLSGALGVNKEQIPQVPPVELELVSVNSQVATLDDGKKVIVVSGKVFNSSSTIYREVKVEASLFDKNNRTIQTLIVPLKNGLSGPAKINTLKIDAINALQKKEINADQEIKPTQSLPFKVVFTSHIDSASYFSSRVFSVNNNSKNK